MNRWLAVIVLPFMVPLACAWVRAQERRILAEGVPLPTESQADAEALGVRGWEKVRVLCVKRVPLPSNPFTRAAARLTGSLATEPIGLAAGRGIYVRAGHEGRRALLAHELVHTAQYERLGGIRPFLKRYLRECLHHGYVGAPLEIEAIERSTILINRR